MEKFHQSKINVDLKIIFSLIAFAVLTRIAIPPFIGHPPNFSPIDAVALFCGAYFNRRILAFLLVFLAAWIGDILLSKIIMAHWVLFYPGCYWQYASYLLITTLGFSFKQKSTPLRLAFASVASSCLFFFISNFGVWYSGFLYPLTLDGLITCYIAAIPFFKNTLLSDLFFSLLLFSIFGLLRMHSLRRYHPF